MMTAIPSPTPLLSSGRCHQQQQPQHCASCRWRDHLRLVRSRRWCRHRYRGLREAAPSSTKPTTDGGTAEATAVGVLLTALLRMYGYPARTVIGLYVSLEEPVLAYGHAWAEYYSADGWTGLDGTRLGNSVGAQHVPLGLVEDESIGYALGLIGIFQMLAIDRVIVE